MLVPHGLDWHDGFSVKCSDSEMAQIRGKEKSKGLDVTRPDGSTEGQLTG